MSLIYEPTGPETMIRAAGKTLYVKDDLRPFAPVGFLTAEEANCETVFLPDRQDMVQEKLL